MSRTGKCTQIDMFENVHSTWQKYTVIWLNRFKAVQLSLETQKLCNQKDAQLKFINNHPYRDLGPTAKQKRRCLKIFDGYKNI